jgi:hypothetical protein
MYDISQQVAALDQPPAAEIPTQQVCRLFAQLP